MLTAIVMIDVEPDAIPEVAEQCAALEYVSAVYSVTGDFDLIAIIRVPEHGLLAEVITGKLSKLPGIRATQTHLAFREYSSRDLEAAFDIGLE